MSVRRTLLWPLAVAGLALLAGAPAAVAAPAAATAATAATSSDPARVAAGWLATRLVGGDHMEVSFDGKAFPDQGLTADAVLALDGAGVGASAAGRATTWLTGQVTAYVGDGSADSFAGAHAKLALVAVAQGLDPEAFGGRHLLTELRALQAPSGRFSDVSSFGDFSNGITQSLAILALRRSGSDVPAVAVDFLAGAQCANGGFPLNFGDASCVADADTTGFAVQALLAAGRSTAASAALDWLESAQKSDGGFGGTGPTAGENSNSTALAGQALRAGGRAAAADRAAGYLRARQVGCSGSAANQGAVAYDTKAFAVDTATRATAQAVLALAGVGLADVSAKGAVAAAPRLTCATPTPTPTPTHTTAPATTPPAASGAGSGGGLPATGAPTGRLTALGALLLLAGTGLVLLARQRHALRRAPLR